MTDAIVFGGAFARGAFEAGALEALAACGIRPTRLVGTSSGGLNATYASAYPEDPAGLVALWRTRATALGILRPAWSCKGLSSTAKLRALVNEVLPRKGQGIDLRLVTTDRAGVQARIGDAVATSFERVTAFARPDFGDERTRCQIVDAAVASAAIPIVFEPSGSEMDGGLVNATPIKHAIADNDVDRVFVIVPFPRVYPCTGASLTEAAFQERLVRDLREANGVNRALAALDRFENKPAILDALGWTGRRSLRVVEVRPKRPLNGGTLSALFCVRLREEYIAEGARAADKALQALSAA